MMSPRCLRNEQALTTASHGNNKLHNGPVRVKWQRMPKSCRTFGGASKLARATCGDAPLPAAVGKRIVHATPRAPAALIALLEEQTAGQTLLCASWPKEEAVPEELQDGFRIVEFGLPDEEGRMRMLKHRAKKMRLAEDVVLSDIAKKMEGMSASKVFEACDAAATRCVREHMDADLDADGLAKVAVSAAHFVL